jgi:hypothetical protein
MKHNYFKKQKWQIRTQTKKTRLSMKTWVTNHDPTLNEQKGTKVGRSLEHL